MPEGFSIITRWASSSAIRKPAGRVWPGGVGAELDALTCAHAGGGIEGPLAVEAHLASRAERAHFAPALVGQTPPQGRGQRHPVVRRLERERERVRFNHGRDRRPWPARRRGPRDLTRPLAPCPAGRLPS